MEVIKKYTPEEAQKLRETIIEKHIVPVVKDVFDKYPKIQSAILTFAQYWSDEADDAVYPSIIFSLNRDPDFKKHITRLNEAYFYEKYGFEVSCKWRELVEGPDGFVILGVEENSLGFYSPHWKPWPGNDDAISAFAAYCMENTYVVGTYGHDDAPYGLIRRKAGPQLSIEVVSEMIRPWMDGVMPEWEQNES